METIRIFDTTLRDGEQSPGCSMSAKEKLLLARQLDRLGVDVIEAGFAASSPGILKALSKLDNKLVERRWFHFAEPVSQILSEQLML